MSALVEGHLAYVTGSYLATGVLLVGLLFASLAARQRARRSLVGFEKRMPTRAIPTDMEAVDTNKADTNKMGNA